MQPSIESRVEDIKQEASSPQKQFTREEIEKHNKDDDCWIVVNGKVYDATSVLKWHPGGKAPIMGHAGKVHADTTDEFESIHDDYAQKKLNGKSATFCCLSCSGTDREHRVRPRRHHRKGQRVDQEAGRGLGQRQGKISPAKFRGCP